MDTLFDLGVKLSKGLRDEDENIIKVLSRNKSPQTSKVESGAPKFDGQTFDDKLDGPRLTKQLDRVREYMLAIFPAWKTLEEISKELKKIYKINFLTQSISARLRDLRKNNFGSYEVKRKRREDEEYYGIWEYLVKKVR